MAEKDPPVDQEEDVIVTLDGDEVEPDEKEDKPLATHADDEDEDGEGGSDDEDASDGDDAKRIARREERKRKREKARHDKEAMQRELAMLRSQNAEVMRRLENVDKRTVTQDISQIDAALTQASQAIHAAEREMAQAVAAGNGEMATAAQRKIYAAMRAGEQLTEIKKRMVAQPSPQQGIDPVLQSRYKAWQAKNSWYDPSRRDQDSKLAFTIDEALAEEGWNPREQGYWDELDRRLTKVVPHRYQQPEPEAEAAHARPRAPTGATTKNSSVKPNQMRLSPERVHAMKEAGVWDDPEARKRYIKRYAEYDRTHKGE